MECVRKKPRTSEKEVESFCPRCCRELEDETYCPSCDVLIHIIKVVSLETMIHRAKRRRMIKRHGRG